eukprot:CAMPEP_0117419038 /NCGR_PEP_ID=MMETSP0758-20121206/699_1 /TAXON_ID=63605 /ORGANISM="Percolomonas cosmopolitus, Strain AE-1 (ATCC 50343)" /LENGTH=51 /DNA_ID=CAMNT_0005199901 /DNA_START=521 /DNA_END=676 /DNA_ORIENTATION=-
MTSIFSGYGGIQVGAAFIQVLAVYQEKNRYVELKKSIKENREKENQENDIL